MAANPFKAGHWGVGSIQLRANRDDLRGVLTSRAFSPTNNGFPLSTDDSGTGVVIRRPVVLPKGQEKFLQTRFHLPYKNPTEERRPAIENRFTFGGAEIEGGTGLDGLAELQRQEYNLLILTKRPDAWGFWTVGEWTALPSDNDFKDDLVRWLRVVRPTLKDLEYLPDSLLAWTSTAVVVWDDLHPDQLTEPVKDALIDWVHWGGKLIVNGPACGDTLGLTPLGKYLPLQEPKLSELPSDSIQELIKEWSIEEDQTATELARKLEQSGAMVGLQGTPTSSAQPMEGTGELLWRQRVGRGVCTISRIDLSSAWLGNWRSGSSFMNATMQLPNRRWDRSRSRMVVSGEYQGRDTDTSLITNLRLLARDASSHRGPILGDDPLLGWSIGPGGSFGEWSSHSPVLQQSLEHLREVSGIEIPKRDFLVRSLGIYLGVLIPVNFLFFWVVGRLEWAWALTPIIAVVGAGWITRSASLDIGFARSLNELSVLELQPEHTRGHLLRTLALYNSLSTTYQVRAPDDQAIVTVAGKVGSRVVREAKESIELSFGFEDGLVADGIRVRSNGTGMIRMEQMVALKGTISQKEDRILNKTGLDLEDVLVWENHQGQLRVAIVGPLPTSGTAELRFTDPGQFAGWSAAELNAEQMLGYVGQAGSLATGARRLVGRFAGSVPGMAITPAANQFRSQTVVIAHLNYPPSPKSRPDENLRPHRPETELVE